MGRPGGGRADLGGFECSGATPRSGRTPASSGGTLKQNVQLLFIIRNVVFNSFCCCL